MEEISLMATTINQSIDYGKPRSSPNRFSNETGLTMQMEHEKCLEIVFHSNAQIEPSLLIIEPRDGQSDNSPNRIQDLIYGQRDPLLRLLIAVLRKWGENRAKQGRAHVLVDR